MGKTLLDHVLKPHPRSNDLRAPSAFTGYAEEDAQDTGIDWSERITWSSFSREFTREFMSVFMRASIVTVGRAATKR